MARLDSFNSCIKKLSRKWLTCVKNQFFVINVREVIYENNI